MNTNIFVKTNKDVEINYWNGLNREKAFQLEKSCLTKLNSNFECICNIKCNHFPQIINDYPKKYTFLLTDCGFSLDRDESNSIIVRNIEEQVNCIIHNLKKNKVKHLDMHISGKNICINKEGNISVIDFDYAVIDDNCLSDKIKTKLLMVNENYYENLKKKIINIISNKYNL